MFYLVKLCLELIIDFMSLLDTPLVGIQLLLELVII
jgi:hypothetical protein